MLHEAPRHSSTISTRQWAQAAKAAGWKRERAVRIKQEVGVGCISVTMRATCNAVAHCRNHSNVVRREFMDGMCRGVRVGGAGERGKRRRLRGVFGANG